MVRQKEKKQMVKFVAKRLEDSFLYSVTDADADHLMVELKDDASAKVYVILHNRKRSLAEYAECVRENRSRGNFVCNVFYKDDENFMVRLAGRAQFKGDERSLKNYDKAERDKMVHLRGLEKEVLRHQSRNPTLVYFQPDTERLDEAVVGYSMRDVEFDYSHVGPGDPGYGFVRNSTSVDYKIADEQFRLVDGGAIFVHSVPNSAILVLSQYVHPRKVQ